MWNRREQVLTWLALAMDRPPSRGFRLSRNVVMLVTVVQPRIMLRRCRHDMIERSESAARIEPTLANEPMANAEANDPIEPIDKTDPTLPIDRIEFLEPIDRAEPSDRIEHQELWSLMDPTLLSDAATFRPPCVLSSPDDVAAPGRQRIGDRGVVHRKFLDG